MIASRPLPSERTRRLPPWPERPRPRRPRLDPRKRPPWRRPRRRSTSTSSPIRTRSATTSIQFVVPEFTCNCPLTGQPDFAHFTIEMVCRQAVHRAEEPEALLLELSRRRRIPRGGDQRRSSTTSSPRRSRASSASAARWNVRGGIYTNVVAEHRKKGWRPAPAVALPPAANPTMRSMNRWAKVPGATPARPRTAMSRAAPRSLQSRHLPP